MRTLLAILLGPLAAAAQLSFVSCPILRDTKTLPCWLAEFEGETYFLGTQEEKPTGVTRPQQMHEVLVEGTVAPGPKVCGGIPLSPVRLSVMPELTRSCNTVLAARDEITAPPPQPPALPSIQPSYVVDFDFDSDRPSSPIAIWDSAAATLKAEVVVARETIRLSDGRTLTETEGIDVRRANRIVADLVRSGIPRDSIRITLVKGPRRAIIKLDRQL